MESSSVTRSPLSDARPRTGTRAWFYLALIANCLLPLTLISTILLGPAHTSGIAGTQVIEIAVLFAVGAAFTCMLFMRKRSDTRSSLSRTDRDSQAFIETIGQTWTRSAATVLSRAQDEALPACVAYIELDAGPAPADEHAARSNIKVHIGLEDCKFHPEDVCCLLSSRRIGIVWFDCTVVQGLQRSRQIIRVIRDDNSDSSAPVTASIGLIEQPGYAGISIDYIEQRVQERLLSAKSSGGDTVLFSSLNPASGQRESLAA